MNAIITIARRELSGFFFSPIGYVVLFLFLLFEGILFGLSVFIPGQMTELRGLFLWTRFGLFFIIPLLTMAMFADEYRSGRMEMLQTSPLSEWQLLLGKYLGAMAFYCVLMLSTLVYFLLLVIFGRPDYGAVLANYLGILLLGGFFVSIGLFFSVCTKDQLIAALASLICLGLLTFMDELLVSRVPESFSIKSVTIYIREIILYVSVGPHMSDFAKGVIDTTHVAYFGIGSSLFLFLAYLILETRKWR